MGQEAQHDQVGVQPVQAVLLSGGWHWNLISVSFSLHVCPVFSYICMCRPRTPNPRRPASTCGYIRASKPQSVGQDKKTWYACVQNTLVLGSHSGCERLCRMYSMILCSPSPGVCHIEWRSGHDSNMCAAAVPEKEKWKTYTAASHRRQKKKCTFGLANAQGRTYLMAREDHLDTAPPCIRGDLLRDKVLELRRQPRHEGRSCEGVLCQRKL